MSWLIVGGGISGLGAAKLLKKLGHRVRVSDGKKISGPLLTSFHAIDAEVFDGGHSLDHLNGIDSLVVSPGVPSNHLLVVAAISRGIPVVSEIDLAMNDFSGKLIGITGTNGKSTTTVMIGHLLKKLNVQHALGGNLGDPPSAIKATSGLPGVMALELSSYQLEQSKSLKPLVTIFTSFSNDHMARHGSLKSYFEAKWSLILSTHKDGMTLIPRYITEQAFKFGLKMPECEIIDPTIPAQGKDSFIVDKSTFPEKHNQLNAACAIYSVAKVCSVPRKDLVPMLKDFKGLPHRCEVIGAFSGRPVINDSKSTNVESTLVALESQSEPVVLMMGGQGKGEEYSPLLSHTNRIKRLITFGASGAIIAETLSKFVPTVNYATLQIALLSELQKCKSSSSTLLFSPGCASFDEFNNYEHRGDTFRSACKPYLDK